MIRQAKIVIWDEAAGADNRVLQAVSRMFQDVMKNKNLPFGAKKMVLAGDFRQCLPIVKNASRTQVLLRTLKYATFWSQIHVFRLVKNKRVENEESKDWCDFILRVGNGREPLEESRLVSLMM